MIHPLGVEPLAGFPPTVTLTVPSGTVSTGGPTIVATWAYPDTQGSHRVQAANDAETVIYYDSGWLGGDDTTHVVDVDAGGLPHDSSDVSWRVRVRTPEGVESTNLAAIVMAWGNPQTTITAPVDNATVTEPGGLVVSWSFADPGKTQSAYRVRLLYEDSQSEAFSTGWVASAATSATLDFQLLDATRYLVEVQTKNNHGIRSA